MALHIQLTLVLFFVNALLTLFYPQYSFLTENIYEVDELGEYTYNDDVNHYVSSGLDEDAQNSVNTFGLFDVFALGIDYIKFILNFFVALPILTVTLPISGVTKLMFFFPTMLLYAFAIMGWILNR